jgi:MYXO-CTERM domain-containing protein
MAPDAELVMAAERGGGREYAMTNFCINRGSRVVLHEYAPWQGYHLDGSSELEQLIDESSLEGVVHINPAGNLSTSQKLMRRTLDASGTTSLPIVVPAINATFFGTTLLWLDASRDLSFRIESPSGAALDIGTGQNIVQSSLDGKTLYAYREDSPRGTAKLDIYLFDENVPTAVEPGDWRVIVSDTSGQAPIELIGSVQDEVSGWGLGAHFTEHVTEDHLVGWPGTADRGLAVSAYVGHGDFPYAAGEEGARAYYSGRGHRIDGVPLMWISAPDNPIVPARFSDQELGYLIYGGTSGASPHVAGSAALMLENDPALDGDGVKALIKAGAFVDAFTGAVPNDDFGWGKLDTYRSIFGRSAPEGTAPELTPLDVTVEVGTSSIPLTVTDKEDAIESLRLDADLDYDGVFDQELASSATPELELNFSEPGSHVIKLRASDVTGRSGQALLRVSVVEPEPEPEPEPENEFDPAFYPAGGCGVTSSGGSPSGLFVAGLALAVALGAARRRSRS